MRKGNAPFVFSACFVASVAVVGCSGDDSNAPPVAGGAGDSSGGGAGAMAPGAGGGTGEVDGGRGGRGDPGFGDGGGGIRFIFDAQALRDTSDPNCPSGMPMDNDPCAAAATCAYPGGGCTCLHEGRGDAGRTWHCQEFPLRDGGYMTCDVGTASGTGCETQGKFCTTGNQTCGCFGTSPGDRKWTCFE
jgi:hypothetical protein